MKRTFVTLLVVMVALLAAEAASAHVRSARVHHRQAMQRARIRQGWRHGDLTVRERVRLLAGQARIRRMEWYARRDGHLSLHERRRLERIQNHQSRVIRRLRHNDRSR